MWCEVLTRVAENPKAIRVRWEGGGQNLPRATQNTEPVLDEIQDCAQWSNWFQANTWRQREVKCFETSFFGVRTALGIHNRALSLLLICERSCLWLPYTKICMQRQTCAAPAVQLSLCSVPVDKDFRFNAAAQSNSFDCTVHWHTVDTIFSVQVAAQPYVALHVPNCEVDTQS